MADQVTVIEFDLDYGDSVKQTEKLTKELIEQKDKIKELGKSHRDLEKVLGSNAESVKRLKKAELEAKDELIRINRERKKAIDITKIQANTLEGLRKQTKALFAEREKLNTSTAKGAKRFAELTKKIKTNNIAIRKADSATRSYSNSFRKGLIRMVAFAGGIALLFRGIKDIINTFKDFEKAMDKLQAITGATRQEIRLLRQDAKDLGATTSRTSTQVAELQTEFAKLGFSVKEIREVTKATIELSIAAGTDLSQAATIAGATIRGFGLDTSETQRVVDVMAKSFATSALDINKFQTAMATVAPVAKSAGVTLEEVTATLGKLTDSGLDASTAGTGLRNVYLELSKQGLTLDEALGMIQNSTDKNKTSMELFGKRGATVGTIMANTSDDIDDLTESLENSNGAAKEMAKTMEDNLAGDITIAGSAWEGFILSIEDGGGTISSTMRNVVSAFTSGLQALVEFNSAAGKLRRQKFLEGLDINAKSATDQFDLFRESIKGTADEELSLSELADKFLDKQEKKLKLLKEEQKLRFPGASEEEIKVLGAFLDKNETTIQVLEARIAAVRGLVTAENELKLVQLKQAEEKKKIDKEIADNKAKIDEKARKDFQEIVDEQDEEDEKRFEKEQEKEQEKSDLLFQQKGEAKLKELELEEETNAKILEEKEKLNNALLSGSRLAANTLFNVLGNSLKNEETRINDSFSKRQKALKDQLNNGIITQEEFDKKSKALERTKAQELHKIELAKFNQKRVQAFANIAIDIAQAVAKVWAESGLAGIVTQALPIAAGVVQAGIVASQPAPQAPTFKEGGDVKSFLIGGNSHEAGGTTFAGSDGSKFVAEKDEAMFITKKGNATLQALAHINSLNGGRGLDNVSQFFAEGGSVITSGTDVDLIQATVSAVLENVVIVTQVEDIQTGLDDRDDVINAGVI